MGIVRFFATVLFGPLAMVFNGEPIKALSALLTALYLTVIFGQMLDPLFSVSFLTSKLEDWISNIQFFQGNIDSTILQFLVLTWLVSITVSLFPKEGIIRGTHDITQRQREILFGKGMGLNLSETVATKCSDCTSLFHMSKAECPHCGSDDPFKASGVLDCGKVLQYFLVQNFPTNAIKFGWSGVGLMTFLGAAIFPLLFQSTLSVLPLTIVLLPAVIMICLGFSTWFTTVSLAETDTIYFRLFGIKNLENGYQKTSFTDDDSKEKLRQIKHFNAIKDIPKNLYYGLIFQKQSDAHPDEYTASQIKEIREGVLLAVGIALVSWIAPLSLLAWSEQVIGRSGVTFTTIGVIGTGFYLWALQYTYQQAVYAALASIEPYQNFLVELEDLQDESLPSE